MADLTTLVPSFGRPKSAVQLCEAVRDTAESDTRLVFILSENDIHVNRYLRVLNGIGEAIVVPEGRRGMCDALHSGYKRLIGELGFAVAFMGDDHRPRTVGWDTHYITQLREMGTGFVYGNDLFQYDRIPTQIAMTSDIPRALGYMTPPGFQHLWVDVVWKDWGEGINRIKYLPDTIVEHMHPLAKKGKNDTGYEQVNSLTVVQHDKFEYDSYRMSGQMKKDIEILKKLR